jgi:hypothetical protein
MKDQFETKIKSLVEDFSYDYDPKAWDALSKKLPRANGGLSWLGKIAIVGILSIGLLSIWYNLNPKNERSNSTAQVVKNKTQNSEKTNQLSSQTVQKSTTPTKTKAKQNIPVIAPNNTASEGLTPFTQEVIFNPDLHLAPLALRQQHASMPIVSESFHDDGGQMPQVQERLLPLDMPSISSTPCKGPKIMLDADAINYEDGTPRIHVTAETMASDLNWNVNGSVINKKNKSFDLLAFKGQTYTISAEGQLDGCKSSETIKITANEDYNLLAVNAFNPQSRDERNATFMPYALTIRDVQFNMVILDPDNGAVVFKSSDAQNAWDGIDQRTGQMVPANKAYIWKVVLQETLPGEKSTYSGTIVRI